MKEVKLRYFLSGLYPAKDSDINGTMLVQSKDILTQVHRTAEVHLGWVQLFHLKRDLRMLPHKPSGKCNSHSVFLPCTVLGADEWQWLFHYECRCSQAALALLCSWCHWCWFWLCVTHLCWDTGGCGLLACRKYVQDFLESRWTTLVR